MKIISIKISNILSFEYKKHLTNSQEIHFDKNMNILIGTTGSGKSNFLEIISEIFKKGILRDCPFTIDEIINYKENPTDDTNRLIDKSMRPKTYSFEKNNHTKNNNLMIQLNLELTDSDFKNLLFIQKHVDDLERLLREYYRISPDFSGVSAIDLKNINKVFSITFDDTTDPSYLTAIDMKDKTWGFVFKYLLWFEFLQNCIIIANLKESKNWQLLNSVFSLLGSYRDYEVFESKINLEDMEKGGWRKFRGDFLNRTIRGIPSGEPIPITYAKYRIAQKFNEIREEIASQKRQLAQGEDVKDILAQTSVFGKLNEVLWKNLKIRLNIEKAQATTTDFVFRFVDKNGNSVNISQLSAGERGIIQLIFSIFGIGLEHGVVILDEPELHIFPRMQRKILDIINKAIQELDLQFIIATHSPVFVNEKTVEGLMRFYLDDNGFTEVVQPKTIPIDIRNKIRMLNFTNSAIIFFTKKVILVEGYPDKIFFQTYLNNFAKRNNLNIDDVEFLDMGSKNEYKKWKDLLDEFKIETYYIGDYDNLVKSSISSNYQKWRSFFPNQMLYKELSNFQNSNNSEYQNIMNEIKNLYSKNIFLLNNGSLEDYYLLINSKNPITEPKPNTEDIVNFCINQLDSWISKNQTNSIVREIDGMFSSIM